MVHEIDVDYQRFKRITIIGWCFAGTIIVIAMLSFILSILLPSHFNSIWNLRYQGYRVY